MLFFLLSMNYTDIEKEQKKGEQEKKIFLQEQML